jgi:hypothetical protein
MPDLTRSLQQQLKQVRLPGLDLPAPLQVPVYDGFSIVNLPASICAWLGLDDWPTSPLNARISGLAAHKYRQVIQIVVDGLGLELFQRFDREDSREIKTGKLCCKAAAWLRLPPQRPPPLQQL